MTDNRAQTIRHALPLSGIFMAATEAKPFVDANKWENLSPDQKAQQAWDRFGNGDTRPEVVRIIEASIPGADRDGVLTTQELQKLEDIRNDKAFMDGLKDTAIIMAEAATLSSFDGAFFRNHFAAAASGIVIPDATAEPAQPTPAQQQMFTLPGLDLLGPQLVPKGLIQ